jgi:3-hydroxyisobutyrate dehydrogenase-like beta-hydroxyacid dehydrogenase
MSPHPTVAVLGLGAMGSALARALLRRGCDVLVWNRTPARAEPLLASGARSAGSIADAVAASELVVICVLDHQASHALLESAGVAEKLSGKTIVDLSSGIPEELEAEREWVSRHGGHFIAGGIMAFPAGIGQQDTVIVYAGDGPAFEQHRSTLTYLGGSLEYLGPDPQAAFYAYSTLGIFVEGAVALFLEASAVARRHGIPMDTYFRLTRLARDMLQGQLRDCADRVVSQQFGGEQASIDLHLHFVQQVCATFAKSGIPVKMTDAYLELLKLARDRGYGSNDLAAIAAALSTERTPS